MRIDAEDLLWFLVLVIVVIVSAFTCSSAQAIKKRPVLCETERDRLQTDLRLRTAELAVTRGQLDSTLKRLATCAKGDQ